MMKKLMRSNPLSFLFLGAVFFVRPFDLPVSHKEKQRVILRFNLSSEYISGGVSLR